jgi:uncharacterized membrane protein
MLEESANSRLETFCDAVFAIALTILVLELKAPLPDNIHNSNELWQWLLHLLPSIFAFILSFTIISISWVNHHVVLKLINKSTPRFIYANIFLLFTVAIIPFPTALLAEFIAEEAAAPAVAIYSFSILLTNFGWILLIYTALKPASLAKNEIAKARLENGFGHGLTGFVLYSLCTVLAFWFPHTIAITISLTWIYWLIRGLNYKDKN